MNAKKVFWWIVGSIVAVFIVAAVSIPNLLRSSIAADEASRVGRMRAFATMESKLSAPMSAGAVGAQPDRKLIRRVALELIVANVDAAATDLRRITANYRGAVDRVQLRNSGSNASGDLELRVPSDQLETALAEFKKVAVRVGHEEVNAKDVTHEWADNDARLRNMKSEEQQYLEIMKRAGTIKETLEVTEKLSDVRGRIEELQAEINVMQHDVEMSAVAIMLVPQTADPGLLADWHPLLSARGATGSLLGGLSAWVDFMVGALILLPAILLWGGTVIGAFLALYWILKRISRKYGKSAAIAPSAS